MGSLAGCIYWHFARKSNHSELSAAEAWNGDADAEAVADAAATSLPDACAVHYSLMMAVRWSWAEEFRFGYDTARRSRLAGMQTAYD